MRHTTAAIGVFAYNRSAAFRQTLTGLERCVGFLGARVHVFCDDARSETDRAAVDDTRRTAVEWCRHHGARLVLRQGNRGFRNLSDGVGELCAEHGCAISLDDDHEVSPHLLTFLDRALDTYREDDRVYQVAGYFPGATLPGDCPDAFFVPFPMSMAWGTWQRAWSRFRWDISEDGRRVLDDAEARHRFDLGGRYLSSRRLELALSGAYDSYLIRWHLAMFLAGSLALCTKRSLVRNFGFTSGVHASRPSEARERFFNGRWAGAAADPAGWALPADVAVDDAIVTRLCDAVRSAGITKHLARANPAGGPRVPRCDSGGHGARLSIAQPPADHVQ